MSKSRYEFREEAEERAKEYKPKFDPSVGGLVAAMTAFGAGLVFCLFARLDYEGFTGPLAGLAAVGFAVGYLYYRNQGKTYSDRVWKLCDELKRDHDRAERMERKDPG